MSSTWSGACCPPREACSGTGGARAGGQNGFSRRRLAGVPAHRRELLESAREVVSDLVEAEEKAIESDSDDARVEACFGGRDLVKLYVKEKESLSKSELIAKQKWWARCNATEPRTTKKRKEPEEPGALAMLFTLFMIVCLISACAADPQARQPAARRAA